MEPLKNSVNRHFIGILLFSCLVVSAGAQSKPGSAKTCKPRVITKAALANLVDSFLDLDDISPRDIDCLNYYAEVLSKNRCDTATIPEYNLADLSFYSKEDERALFPLVKLESFPPNYQLKLESPYLGYYHTPFKGVVTSNYGWREGKLHKGIDIDLNKGDKVLAAFSGKVRLARRQGGFGNVVIIMHPNGLETVYAHLSRIKVKSGQIIQSGQVIGLGGNTGHSSGSHLHFELRYKGYPLNPGAVISFEEDKLFYHTVSLRCSGQLVSAFPANCHLHKVNKGESWRMIALRYGLSLKELMALNGIGRRYYLKAGQVVRIN